MRVLSVTSRPLLAGMILLVSFGMAAGAGMEFTAIVTKTDGKHITFTKAVKGGGPEMTERVSDTVKVAFGKLNKETKKFDTAEPLAGGLKNEMFSSGKVVCRLVTDDNGTITQVIVVMKKKP